MGDDADEIMGLRRGFDEAGADDGEGFEVYGGAEFFLEEVFGLLFLGLGFRAVGGDVFVIYGEVCAA